MIFMFGGFVGWIPEFLNLWVERVHTIQIIIRHYFFKQFFSVPQPISYLPGHVKLLQSSHIL